MKKTENNSGNKATENTPENKARFFAQYAFVIPKLWHTQMEWQYCNIIDLIARRNERNEVFHGNNDPEISFWQLPLRPLSSITGPEAIELMRFMGFNQIEDEATAKATILALFVIKSNDIMKYELIVKQMLFDFGDISSVVDKIRSMGFAYRYLDLSVEDLVAYGWVVLSKEDEK